MLLPVATAMGGILSLTSSVAKTATEPGLRPGSVAGFPSFCQITQWMDSTPLLCAFTINVITAS